MIRISKYEREQLEKNGLVKYRQVGHNPQDANIQVTNREHMSRDKTYYITEEPRIMKFLGHFEGYNMQKISDMQLKKMMAGNIITNDNVQHSGEYKTGAVVYVKNDGTILMEKVSKFMIYLGIWKANHKSY